MNKIVKSGKEILDDFFHDIRNLENIDKALAQMLSELYEQEKLTDANVKNELLKLKETNGNKD